MCLCSEGDIQLKTPQMWLKYCNFVEVHRPVQLRLVATARQEEAAKMECLMLKSRQSYPDVAVAQTHES